ncbi:MAG: FadR/GntR family transcriptional regulator [Bacillus sp. (in: firmicutes)]
MSNMLLYEKIASILEDEINNGKYKIGEKLLSERELSKRFNVSRNIIRESVKLLKEKGLVNVVQGKGSYVTNRNSENLISSIKRIMKHNNGKLQDIVEIREVLEQKIVVLAVERATDEQILKLEQIVLQMEQEMDYSKQMTTLDLEFHSTLAKCTHNPLFLELMNSISVLLDESIHLLMMLFPQTKKNVIIQHAQIVEAIKKRDKEQAIKVFSQHLKLVRKEMEQASFLLKREL